MLEFFDLNDTLLTASIYDSHITFNRVGVKYFTDAYRARVGIDKEEKRIYVFLLNKDSALSGEYSEGGLIKVSLSKTYARICSKNLIQYICNNFDLKIHNKEYKRFKAMYSNELKAIIIEMEEGINA